VNDRPVRLVVRDDLRRSRLTVFFRLFLGIPHFIWLGFWTFGVFFTAFAQWIVTIVRGRPAESLNTFHIHYVRYGTHLTAYLGLVANPFPAFLGEPGYPIDLVIEPAERQRRLSAAFRLVLALPAIFFMSLLNGGGPGGAATYYVAGGGVVLTVAFLGWFASLARARMPRGMRNLSAYGLRYTAEVYLYVLLVTRTYPSSDPTLPSEAGAPPFRPVRLAVTDDRRRSRLTTFFRFFLTVPHFVWLMLWGVLVIFAVVASWFVTLVRGRPANSLHRFVAAYIRYQTHVYAFLWLIANPFPGFTGKPGYPVDLHVDAPEAQNRWVTAFRLVLFLPAALLNGALQWILVAAGIGGWFAALVTGRMPEGLRNAGAHALRYQAQLNAYAAILTDRYPFSGPPAAAPQLLLFDDPS
jgi:uncharacterized protein DUF4389